MARKNNIKGARHKTRSKSSPWPFTYSEIFHPGVLRKQRTPVLILFAVAIALYGMTITYGYVLDDQTVVQENTFVQKGFGGLRDIFSHDSFTGYSKEQQFLVEGGRYRPLSLASFAIEIGLFGTGHPGLSHTLNILFYGLLVILLYRLFTGWLDEKPDKPWYHTAAFWGAMVFMAHPLHTEVVANIKGRDEIFALLGSCFALFAQFRYFDTRRSKWLLLAAISFFLGLLSKENAVTFLAVIPTAIWVFGKVPLGRAIRSTIPLWIGFLLYLMIRFQVLGYLVNTGKEITNLMNNPFLGMSWGDRYATTFMTLGWYLKLLFVPFPLTSDYYPYHVPVISWMDWRAFVSLLIYLGIAILGILKIRSRHLFAFCILYFLFTLSIASNLLFSVGTFMNERFLFMPSVGFGLWFASFVERLPEWTSLPKKYRAGISTSLIAIVVLSFAFLTVMRTPAWKDSLSLYSRDVKTSRESARAQLFYATALYQDRYQVITDTLQREKLLDTMEYHIKRALAIYPKYDMGWMMRAAVEISRFAYVKDQPKMFAVLDSTMVAIPYHPDFRRLMDQYLQFLATHGGDKDLITDYCYRNGYERFFLKKHDTQSAIQLLDCALETGREDPQILTALAEVYETTGDSLKAATMRQRARLAMGK